MKNLPVEYTLKTPEGSYRPGEFDKLAAEKMVGARLDAAVRALGDGVPRTRYEVKMTEGSYDFKKHESRFYTRVYIGYNYKLGIGDTKRVTLSSKANESIDVDKFIAAYTARAAQEKERDDRQNALYTAREASHQLSKRISPKWNHDARVEGTDLADRVQVTFTGVDEATARALLACYELMSNKQ